MNLVIEHAFGFFPEHPRDKTESAEKACAGVAYDVTVQLEREACFTLDSV
jgi:hypothetical protein